MNSIAGIKHIIIANPNSILSDGFNTGANQYFCAAQVRDKSKLVMTDKGIKDYRERLIPQQKNFKLETKVFDANFRLLQLLVQYYVREGVELQVLMERQTQELNSGGCFRFAGNNFLGVDFDFFLSSKERSCSLTFEASLEYADGKALLSAAETNEVYSLPTSAVSNPYNSPSYFDPSHITFPAKISFYNQAGNLLLAVNGLDDYELHFKTAGSKNSYDRTVVQYIETQLKIESSDASMATLKKFLNEEGFDRFGYIKAVVAKTNEEFIFGGGTFGLEPEATLSDDERKLILNFSARVPMLDIAFDSNKMIIGDNTDLPSGGTEVSNYPKTITQTEEQLVNADGFVVVDPDPGTTPTTDTTDLYSYKFKLKDVDSDIDSTAYTISDLTVTMNVGGMLITVNATDVAVVDEGGVYYLLYDSADTTFYRTDWLELTYTVSEV